MAGKSKVIQRRCNPKSRGSVSIFLKGIIYQNCLTDYLILESKSADSKTHVLNEVFTYSSNYLTKILVI